MRMRASKTCLYWWWSASALLLLQNIAAVNDNYRPVHIRGSGRCQKGGNGANFFCSACSAHRRGGSRDPFGFGRGFGGDPSGSDRVDRDTRATHFQSQRVGEPDHRSLCGGVGGLAGI